MIDLTKIINWKSIVEIIILWAVIYRIFLFLKGTKAVYLLRGIIVLIISLLAFQLLGLPVLTKILTYLFAFFLILVAIIFQPELREGLIRLGRRHIFHIEPQVEEMEQALREIVSSVGVLSRKKIGGLIAIKREIGLKKYTESGVVLDAEVSSELIQNIFYPSAPLHDGGVVIEGTRVVSAACLFPLSDSFSIERVLGMRHRAAVGLSEATDAVIIVISEETGIISLAIEGQLTRRLSPNDLFTILKGQLTKTE
ncbi:MAG: diadenylate cyclase CdaA [Candidatus Omnitrophica bacterium]|nr:diadenylate cyclase CdaA [Candidatus Omnitrophota bacterium]